jgi:hypothetical protein
MTDKTLKDKAIIKCINCNKHFKVRNYRKNLAKYCSKKCMNEYRQGFINVCLNCGDKTLVHKYRKGVKFCSLKCKYQYNTGKPSTSTTKFKPNDKRLLGEKHHNWKGGITSVNDKIRKSLEYELWRKAVFYRDNYTCIWCGNTSIEIHADHIKPFSLFPELRFAIDNGRTLCKDCHKKTDTYGSKIKNYENN